MPPIDKKCANCGKPPRRDEAGNLVKMKTCSRCKIVFYHDVACQKEHWKVHKKSCGSKKATNNQLATSITKKYTHRSNNPVHQLITRRFKELRKQNVPIHEAMKRARDEFQPSNEKDLDAGRKVAAMFGMR